MARGRTFPGPEDSTPRPALFLGPLPVGIHKKGEGEGKASEEEEAAPGGGARGLLSHWPSAWGHRT